MKTRGNALLGLSPSGHILSVGLISRGRSGITAVVLESEAEFGPGFGSPR